jgi:CheY-like chemotaxis protein
LPGLEKVRIIAVTGRVSDDEERALRAGCERFLRKPILPDTLTMLVNSEDPPNLRRLTR